MPGEAHAEAEVDVLEVGEEPLVEQADVAEHATSRYRLAPPLAPNTSPDGRTGSLGASRSRGYGRPHSE